jgi:hypothetical protein
MAAARCTTAQASEDLTAEVLRTCVTKCASLLRLLALGEFNDAISNLDNIGFTFGSHGVYVGGGSARLILTQFGIT